MSNNWQNKPCDISFIVHRNNTFHLKKPRFSCYNCSTSTLVVLTQAVYIKFLFLILLSVPHLFASNMADTIPAPDSVRNNATEIDTTAVYHAKADSGKTDSTVVDSLIAAANAKKALEKPIELTLPKFEILPSRFVEFFNHELAIEGNGLVFNGSFIVLGKAVYRHFDFMMVEDSGMVLTTVTTIDRSYRRDKGPLQPESDLQRDVFWLRHFFMK